MRKTVPKKWTDSYYKVWTQDAEYGAVLTVSAHYGYQVFQVEHVSSIMWFQSDWRA